MSTLKRTITRKPKPVIAEPLTLIKSKTPITVEQLLSALQEAIMIDPTIATKPVLHQNPLGNNESYEVNMKPDSIFIYSNIPSKPHCTCCDCELCQKMMAEADEDSS